MKKLFMVIFTFMTVFMFFGLIGCSNENRSTVNSTTTTKEITDSLTATSLNKNIDAYIVIGAEYKLSEKKILSSCEFDSEFINVIENVRGTFAVGITEGLSNVTITTGESKTIYSFRIKEESIFTIDESVDVPKGASLDLKIKTLSGETPKIVSRDSMIASVSEDGTVTGLRQGITEIVIKSYNVTEVVKVNVTSPAGVISSTIDKTILMKDETAKISSSVLIFNEANSKYQTITEGFKYVVEDDSIVSISSDGTLKGLKEGNTTINVSYPGSSKAEKFNITVYEMNDNFSIFDDSSINWLGRTYEGTNGGVRGVRVDNTASGFEVAFYGTRLEANVYLISSISKMKVIVDDKESVLDINKANVSQDYTLVSGLENGPHILRFLKMTEDDFSRIQVNGLSTDGKFMNPPRRRDFKVEFYGDSITAGYGVLGKPGESFSIEKSDGTSTYAYFLSEMLNAESSMICCQGISVACPKWQNFLMLDRYKYASISSMKSYDLNKFDADLIFINLGTNDSSSSNHSAFESGYKSFIEKIHSYNPDAKIICMIGMMNVSSDIKNSIEKCANEFDYAYFIQLPVGPQGAAGHPSVEANEDAANRIYDFLIENDLI